MEDQNGCLALGNQDQPPSPVHLPLLLRDHHDPPPFSGDQQDPPPFPSEEKDPPPFSGDQQDPPPFSGDQQDPPPFSGDQQDPPPFPSEEKDPPPFSGDQQDPPPFSGDQQDPPPFSRNNHDPLPSFGDFQDPIQLPPLQRGSGSVMLMTGKDCPRCRVGTLQKELTPLGICLGVFCFPCGLICCYTLRKRRCDTCGALF
ncbi:basic salivary proline-rich protein 4-like isoform X4 [Homarus americanus]|uniref:basic salivary proline-rich protein 4-like isoform X4 n=1 Tax=Homarus americanus TaxID=6706 RepID=UPI001C469218|nr:basic salivary proline-rich protein 4-like isoform X4 [Homarus americanus]